MSQQTLWRIDGATEATAVDHEQLAAGVRLHVIHSSLTSVTMQINTQQRSYLALDGCAGCLHDQCRVGCPAALFRRLFGSCVTGASLTAVAPPQGFASRPYTQSIFAWPDASAQPIESTLLHPWADARLILHWRRYGAHICGSALLLTSANGPDPTNVLRTQNWHTLALPIRMVTRWNQTGTPPGLPFGVPWYKSLFLLLPTCSDSEPSVQTELSRTAEIQDSASVSQEDRRR